jgi:hypothetical protein
MTGAVATSESRSKGIETSRFFSYPAVFSARMVGGWPRVASRR